LDLISSRFGNHIREVGGKEVKNSLSKAKVALGSRLGGMHLMKYEILQKGIQFLISK
jgi:hypothetical protein